MSFRYLASRLRSFKSAPAYCKPPSRLRGPAAPSRSESALRGLRRQCSAHVPSCRHWQLGLLRTAKASGALAACPLRIRMLSVHRKRCPQAAQRPGIPQAQPQPEVGRVGPPGRRHWQPHAKSRPGRKSLPAGSPTRGCSVAASGGPRLGPAGGHAVTVSASRFTVNVTATASGFSLTL